MKTSGRVLACLCILALVANFALANAPPYWPPVEAIDADGVHHVPLVVQIDPAVKEAHLLVPPRLVTELQTSADPASQRRNAFAGLLPLHTIVAGLALALSLIFTGIWLVRYRGPARRRYAVLLLPAVVVAGAAIIYPWRDLLPVPANQSAASADLDQHAITNVQIQDAGQVAVKFADTGDSVKLIVNPNVSGIPADEEANITDHGTASTSSSYASSPAEKAPAAPRQVPLVIESDSTIKESCLVIPRNLQARLQDSAETPAGNKTRAAGELPGLRTGLLGLALTLSLAFSGLWLVRSRGSARMRYLALLLPAVVAISAATAVVRADGMPFPPVRPVPPVPPNPLWLVVPPVPPAPQRPSGVRLNRYIQAQGVWGNNGFRITAVKPGGPATKLVNGTTTASLMPGDTIVEVEGNKIESQIDYAKAINAAPNPQNIEIKVRDRSSGKIYTWYAGSRNGPFDD